MAGIFLSILNILTFAKVWQSSFEFYNIPLLLIYIAFPIGYIILCWGVGLWYEQSGLWGEENSHINNNMNVEFLKLCKDMDKIKEKLGIVDTPMEE